MAEKSEKKTAKSRYDKAPHIKGKTDKEAGAGRAPAAERAAKESREKPAAEKEPMGGSAAPKPEVAAGDENVPVHLQQTMERQAMHHGHMKEHDELFHRHEGEIMMHHHMNK